MEGAGQGFKTLTDAGPWAEDGGARELADTVLADGAQLFPAGQLGRDAGYRGVGRVGARVEEHIGIEREQVFEVDGGVGAATGDQVLGARDLKELIGKPAGPRGDDGRGIEDHDGADAGAVCDGGGHVFLAAPDLPRHVRGLFGARDQPTKAVDHALNLGDGLGLGEERGDATRNKHLFKGWAGGAARARDERWMKAEDGFDIRVGETADDGNGLGFGGVVAVFGSAHKQVPGAEGKDRLGGAGRRGDDALGRSGFVRAAVAGREEQRTEQGLKGGAAVNAHGRQGFVFTSTKYKNTMELARTLRGRWRPPPLFCFRHPRWTKSGRANAHKTRVFRGAWTGLGFGTPFESAPLQ